MLTFLVIAGGVLLALLIGLQVFVRLRARALEGKPLPQVPGQLGERLAAADTALIYFMSPGCGACRPWTPKLSELSRRRSDVFVVDVAEDLDVALALGVMATPSTIEVREGRVVGCHVGGVPKDVLGRFA